MTLPGDSYSEQLLNLAEELSRTASGAGRRGLPGLERALLEAETSARSWAPSIAAEEQARAGAGAWPSVAEL